MAQKFLHNNSEEALDLDVSDEVDSNFEDLDQLRQTVKGTTDFIALHTISYLSDIRNYFKFKLHSLN